MESSTSTIGELQQDQSLTSRTSLHSLGVLCLCAMIGLCSCAMSADRGAPPQQQNSPPSQPVNPQKPTIKKATVDPNKFALVVAGVGGEDAYTRKFTAQANRLY